MGFQCHYETLEVALDADAATIKKAHRKKAIKLHPDKNFGDDEAADKFRLVQEAYECLSDVGERRWYDDHRDALLKGWTPNANGEQDDGVSMLFDVIPFMNAQCYTGYGDGDDKGFYNVYGHVFSSLAKEEADAAASSSSDNGNHHYMDMSFGDSTTDPNDAAQFYASWESFGSQQVFGWADKYDLKDADSRKVRRLMEEENKKARKVARKARNEDVQALVRFCKRRDHRMLTLKVEQAQQKVAREKKITDARKRQKQEKLEARQKWRQQAEEEAAEAEEMDRLSGRVRGVRLADLEDDYDYGGGKKKGKKGKKAKKKYDEEEQEVFVPEPPPEPEKEGDESGEPGDDSTAVTGEDNGESKPLDGSETNTETGERDEKIDEVIGDTVEPELEKVGDLVEPELDDDGGEGLGGVDPELEEDYYSDEESESEESSSEEEEPEVFRCECCRKDFKSEGQMENHMKSKKHKEAYKKFQKNLEKEMMA